MALPKENLDEFLKENKGYKVLKRLKDTTIIKLPNGELLKVLDKELLLIIKDTGYDLERRLDEADSFTSFKNFSIPTRKLEHNGRISAYTMPNFPGINFTDYYVDIFNLKRYADIHAQIEENIQTGNELGLVFPELCTTENIIIYPDGKVYFIDYDGIQIKDMPAIGYSDFLGLPREVLTPKYYNEKTGFRSYFLAFEDGARLEIMNRPGMQDTEKPLAWTGYSHIAFQVGSRKKVDELTEVLKKDGYEVVSGPRVTGDGYYESCIIAMEGNQIEITV